MRLYCEHCKDFTAHHDRGTQRILREKVLFKGNTIDNIRVEVPFTGYQTGSAFECQVCNNLRLFGADEDLRESGWVDLDYKGRLPEKIGVWSKLRRSPRQHDKPTMGRSYEHRETGADSAEAGSAA